MRVHRQARGWIKAIRHIGGFAFAWEGIGASESGTSFFYEAADCSEGLTMEHFSEPSLLQRDPTLDLQPS